MGDMSDYTNDIGNGYRPRRPKTIGYGRKPWKTHKVGQRCPRCGKTLV